jgi:peptide/nickel transport system substrate-binding protein
MRGSVRAAGIAAASLLAAAGTAAAQTLTMAVGAPITSLDPHYHQLSPNNAVADMVFDKLVNTDELSRNIPGLAVEWRAVAPTVWEYRLRPNVRFHNGNAFTAEDVAFTLTRLPNVPNSPSSFAAYARPYTRIEIVDPLTIRLHTAEPYPLSPLDMTSVRIVDRETTEGATTEDFNAVRAAVGTGPWRVVAHRSGDRVEFERFDGYWGPAPAFQRVNYRMITNDAARVAALLAGDVEVIDQVPTSDVQKLRREGRVQLAEILGTRLIFLGLDHLRTDASPFVTDNEGRPIPRNPLRDLRVRQALSLAIDRQAIAERIMEGTAVPIGQFLPEGVNGHVPGIATPRFDPEAARRLLAEAGFPQGFRIQLNGPNDRYINDARIIQAIGQMWTRIGVRTSVEAQTWSIFVGRAARQDFSAFLIGWGSSPDASHPLRNILATVNSSRGWGASNRGRYSNPEVDGLLLASLSELDEAKRVATLGRALTIAMEDVAVVPLHVQINIWALRRGLAMTARNDELTRAQDVRPATSAASR